MSNDIPVKGLNELDAFLSALPMNMQKGAYRAALTAAAAPIRDEARALAPRGQTGLLARAIRTGSPRQNQDGSFSISISLQGDHAFIGVFQEYGVRPHLITSGDAKLTVRALNKRAAHGAGFNVLDNGLIKVGGYEYERRVHTKEGTEHRAMKIGAAVIRGAVLHPGFSPHPFLRPALDAKADAAVKAFADRIRAYIEGKTGFAAPVDEAT